MADKDIVIGIKTTGAEASVKAISQVDAATHQLSQTTGRDAARAMQDMSEKARVNEFAHYDLDAAIKGTSAASNTFTAGQTAVQQSSRNSAQALLMFSQGFEDAQYGIRGVLNNIPGLIVALGGTAGLAGAISIAAVTLSQIIPMFTKTEEKASDMADRIKEIADNMGEMEAERFEAVGDAIDSARDRADSLEQSFEAVRTAEQKFATGALGNAGVLAEAQRNITAALGEQVDKYRELQEIAALEAEKRRLATEQEIANENAKRAAAEQSVTKSADYLQAQQQRADIEKANLVTLRGQLEALREQEAVLQNIAAGKGDMTNLPPSLQDFSKNALAGSRNFTDYKGAVKGEAGRLAGDGSVLQTALEGTQKKVDELENLVLTLTKDGGVVEKANNAFLKAQTQLTEVSEVVATNIEGLTRNAAFQDLVATSQTIVASQEQQAKDLTAAVSKIEVTTEAGRTAKAAIEAAAADGRITANESEQLAQASVQIIGQIQAGLATAGANSTEILTVLRAVAQREQSTRRELAELRKMVEDMQR